MSEGGANIMSGAPPVDHLFAADLLVGVRQYYGSLRSEMSNGVQFTERFYNLREVRCREVG